jgi:mono/diheme cytochrome c family protein
MIQINRSIDRAVPATFGMLCCAFLILSACAPDSGGTADGPQGAERGEQVFNENCGACHGVGGRGPALSEIKALSSADRRDRIRNHPVAGQIPQRLPANQLSDVIEFFESD